MKRFSVLFWICLTANVLYALLLWFHVVGTGFSVPSYLILAAFNVITIVILIIKWATKNNDERHITYIFQLVGIWVTEAAAEGLYKVVIVDVIICSILWFILKKYNEMQNEKEKNNW